MNFLFIGILFLFSFFKNVMKKTIYHVIGLFSIIFLISCNPKPKNNAITRQYLHHSWEFKSNDGSTWNKAHVPGSNFTDLLMNGMIPEPFTGDNETRLQWVHKKDWVYKTSFTLEKHILAKENIALVFKGLDTYADVILNDSLVLEANNMFREWEIDVKEMLKKENMLKIYFHSPANYFPYDKPPYFNDLPGKERIQCRKAAYHFGWDWAPKLMPCGIYKPVMLLAWNKIRIQDQHLKILEMSDNLAQVELLLNISSSGKNKARFEYEVENKIETTFLKLKPGINKCSVKFAIKNPQKWWVHNLGKPFLYKLEGKMYVQNEFMDSIKVSFGLRDINLLQEKDSLGKTFGFELNGKPVFMKGANYVPQDVFLSRVKREDYEKLVQSMVEANMNMVRVWGGGVYEKDVFYDLCDQHGILIWQDFMFANAMYVADDDFMENITKEATYQVRKLADHPCIALWCGNNEIDEAWHNWGWSNKFSKKDSIKIWQDYKRIFHEVLPNIVNEYHPKAGYVSTSPKYGRGDVQSLYEGDAHYWGVWHDGYDFPIFDSTTGRFMSEYGFQGFPPLETIKKMTRGKELNLHSKAITNHQKHARGMKIILQYMKKYYTIPKNIKDFIYVSQLLQAEGIRKGIESHRRKKPYCMGTLYWQLNDCWPAISWSSWDYYKNKKALHYFVKEDFKNTMLSIKQVQDSLLFYIINDTFTALKGNLDLKLFHFNGKILEKKSLPIKMEENSSMIVHKLSIKDLTKNLDTSQIVLFSEIKIKDKVIDENYFYFSKPKFLTLHNPGIKISTRRINSNKYEMDLTCNYLAKNVYLNSICKGEFNDNYFDMIPGRVYKTIFFAKDSCKAFEKHLKVKCLNEPSQDNKY